MLLRVGANWEKITTTIEKKKRWIWGSRSRDNNWIICIGIILKVNVFLLHPSNKKKFWYWYFLHTQPKNHTSEEVQQNWNISGCVFLNYLRSWVACWKLNQPERHKSRNIPNQQHLNHFPEICHYFPITLPMCSN